MIQSVISKNGKAAGIALLTALLSSAVMVTVLILVGLDEIPGDAVGEIAWSFFATMGVIGGASQAPNVAERLPGTRQWQHPPRLDGQSRRASDGREGE